MRTSFKAHFPSEKQTKTSKQTKYIYYIDSKAFRSFCAYFFAIKILKLGIKNLLF